MRRRQAWIIFVHPRKLTMFMLLFAMWVIRIHLLLVFDQLGLVHGNSFMTMLKVYK